MNVNDDGGFDDFFWGNNKIEQEDELNKAADIIESNITKPDAAQQTDTAPQMAQTDQKPDIYENDDKVKELVASATRSVSEDLTKPNSISLANRAIPVNLAATEEQLQENVTASQHVHVAQDTRKEKSEVREEKSEVREEKAQAQVEMHQEAEVASIRTERQETRMVDVQQNVQGHVESLKAAKMSEAAATHEKEGIRNEFGKHWTVRLVGDEYHIEHFDLDSESDKQAAREGRVGSHNGRQYEVSAELIKHLKSGKKIIDKRGGKSVEVTLDQVTLMSDEKLNQIKAAVDRYVALTIYIKLQSTGNTQQKEVVNRKAEVVRVEGSSKRERAKDRGGAVAIPAQKSEAHYLKVREMKAQQQIIFILKGFEGLREKREEIKHEDLHHRIEQKLLNDRLKEEQILLDSIE